MGDLKRLILPGIAAIVMHGFLLNVKLPEQQKMQLVQKGIPIKIEINSVVPKTVTPEQAEEYKKEKIIPKITPKAEPHNNKVGQSQIIKPPVDGSRQQKKEIIESEPTKIKAPEKRTLDFQKPQLEAQFKNIKEPLPREKKVIKEIISEPVVKQIPDRVSAENKTKKQEESVPKKESFRAPIQKKAIPVYRQNKQPAYPAMAKQRGYEGEVLLNVLVDAKGSVSEIKIKHSSGHRILDRAALKAVNGWLFTAAIEGGKSVAMWVDVPIIFQLK